MNVDTVVIGAGVIGLATARALALSGREVLVLEANPAIGMEISSRNSEVIHAGLYYEPGSLKARTCVTGRQWLYDYCIRKGVPHRRLGKLIVASGQPQIEQLERIKSNAGRCGVNDLEWLDAPQLSAKEPAVRAEAALWSPSTGIIDSHALMLSLQADLEAAGGIVVCNSPVRSIAPVDSGLLLTIGGTEESSVHTHLLINAAGLHCARLASTINGIRTASIPRIHLVRGHYFGHAGKSPFRHLVYPLPQDGGLGIHATLDLSGQLRFGPDSEPVKDIDYAFDDSRRERFAESIRHWYPDLAPADLQPGYTGIRPRLSGPGEGFRDFEISGPEQSGIAGLFNLYGIESPGLTACLALAERVALAVQSPGR